MLNIRNLYRTEPVERLYIFPSRDLLARVFVCLLERPGHPNLLDDSDIMLVAWNCSCNITLLSYDLMVMGQMWHLLCILHSCYKCPKFLLGMCMSIPSNSSYMREYMRENVHCT